MPMLLPASGRPRRLPVLPLLFLIGSVYLCAIYASLALAVRNSAAYRYFPPFKAHVNANYTKDLAAENYNIARSLLEGKGFAHPFVSDTGATAWMPPTLPSIQAALLWLCDGNRPAVVAIIIFLQLNVLLVTGLLIVLIVRRTTLHIAVSLAVAVVLVEIMRNFAFWFQMTQDCWLVLVALDVLLAGFCLTRPLFSRRSAAVWGVLGGLCALISPVAGFAWVMLTAILGIRQRAWRPLTMTALAAGLTLAPWTVRNYLVFGRLIPVKSNVAYELYQSQCLLADGLLQGSAFQGHPYMGLVNQEGREYARQGEMAFLDKKREQFWQSVSEDPAGFLRRFGNRLLAATLWYAPGEVAQQAGQPWLITLVRLLHPLPFLALVSILITRRWRPLASAESMVILLYLFYLLPYIVVSYWERYAAPLLGLKVVLVIWAADRLWERACARRVIFSSKRITRTAQPV